MFTVEISQRIARCVLFSLLCFDSAFSATIATANRMVDDEEDENIYGEYGGGENVLHFDFFRFTTRGRYIWEDWTIPTLDPEDFGDPKISNHSTNFILYIFIPIFVVAFIVACVCICVKKCLSDESDSYSSRSSNIFTTVHRPPQRRADVSAQVHGPQARRDLFSEMDGSRGTRDVTFSVTNSTYSSPSRGRREPGDTVTERPPDYSTVTINDLINPNKPAFPVVKKNDETPPPEYGKENPFFK